MLEGEKENILSMEKSYHKSGCRQAEALDAVSNAYKTFPCRFVWPNRPSVIFIFKAQRAVGNKLKYVKPWARLFVWQPKIPMIGIDMSEFKEKHSVRVWWCTSWFTVGYEEGGYLTEAVRRKTYLSF